MKPKELFNHLNIIAQCRKYNLPVLQCPQFLFLIMGIVVVVTAVIVYFIGIHYIVDPLIVVLVVLAMTVLLFTISFVIIRSFEKLAETNRLKSEFVSIVSHQLRSPISNLNWAIELLSSGKLGTIEKKQVEYFRILKENALRMKELVSDLLIVSRLEQKKIPLKKREFSLGDLIKDLIDGFKIFARASNVEVSFNVQERLPKVFADPSRIRLVIENLLDNAIRYVNPVSLSIINNGRAKEKGKVEIKIVKDKKNIRFEIKDNGVGVPKADQKYIFQKFFRSENVLKYQTQGSGLGLFIAESIIKQSEGKLWFKSKENKGSTFYFTLPLVSGN